MLNLPQKFKNGFTGKAINVYPIVVINAGGNIIRLAQIKGVFNGEYYEDRNLTISSINEKIDIADKKFQINQVNITVSNYIIEQIRFSEKFKGFSFTNAEVEIYYANEGCDTLEDCLQIFKGFVKDYSGNQEKVSFSVEDHSQYTLDNKTFPRNKTLDPPSETVDASKNIYFPVVYGHVDKSPMVFTRNNPTSLTSYMFPDAVFTQEDEKQIDSELKVKQLEKDYQEMILKFETRIKELELQYGTKINEGELRNNAMLAKEEIIQQGKIQEQAQKALLEQQKSALGNLDRRQQTVINPNDGQE